MPLRRTRRKRDGIMLARSLLGDVSSIDQQGDTWLYHRDGFVACEYKSSNRPGR